MNKKPYIVSGDIHILLSRWAQKKDFILPQPIFFSHLRKEFSTYMQILFPCFEFIEEQEILRHMDLVRTAMELPCLSLDPVYSGGNLSIDITRKVDSRGLDVGLYRRFDSAPLCEQLKNLQSQGLKEVCLFDDVIFSGELLKKIIKLLSGFGIHVPAICAGVIIGDKIDSITRNREVHCFKKYPQVIDEVCERDFYMGIPYGGRSLFRTKENMGLPYILPFGNPTQWASIPTEYTEDFSRFCLGQSISLFKEIEKTSDKEICCSDIERKVPGQPIRGNYVKFLESLIC